MSFIGKLIRPAAFTQLRTNEGLGYIVWAGHTVRQGVNGLYITVQSPKKVARAATRQPYGGPDAACARVPQSAYYLNRRITSFLKTTFRDFLTGFSADEYAKMFGDARDRTLGQRGRWWREIVSQEYNFYRWRHEARLLHRFSESPAPARQR
jgi:secreted Zn-dependent insulinase-like peptidase